LPHAVQKSKNEKRQKDADDCVKQAFFSEDHISNVPLEAVLGAAAFFAECAPWRVPMIHAENLWPRLHAWRMSRKKVAVPAFYRYTE
jgi:hypothetical protein